MQRRLALIGDGLDTSPSPASLGLVLDRAPVGVALLTATAGAVLLELIRVQGRTSGDIVAVLFYGGIAAGVVIVSRRPRGAQPRRLPLRQHHDDELVRRRRLPAVLTAVILVVTGVLGRALFSVSNDEEFARATGLPVVPEPPAGGAHRVHRRRRHAGDRGTARQCADGRAMATCNSSAAASGAPLWRHGARRRRCRGRCGGVVPGGHPRRGTIVVLSIIVFLVALAVTGVRTKVTDPPRV